MPEPGSIRQQPSPVEAQKPVPTDRDQRLNAMLVRLATLKREVGFLTTDIAPADIVSLQKAFDLVPMRLIGRDATAVTWSPTASENRGALCVRLGRTLNALQDAGVVAACNPDGSLTIAFSLYPDADPTNEKFSPGTGDTVRVQDEDGSIEPGWVVQRKYLTASQGVSMVVLAKGERTQEIPTAHLSSLNRRAQDADLAMAENPHVLFDTIRRLGRVETRKGTSSAAEAIGTINGVLAGEKTAGYVTSQNQLRSTVTRLKNNFGSSRK